MGLSVVITKPADRDWFTSSESVHGAVVWEKQSPSNVSSIIVRLEGQLKLAVRPATSHQRHRSLPAPHILFVQEKTVFPISNNGQRPQQGGKTTLASGTHRFPFELKFPKLGDVCTQTGCSHCQKALPPTLKFTADAFSGSVTYVVRAVADRDQLLRSKISAISEVQFRPLLPTTALLIDQPWLVKEQITSTPLGRSEPDKDVASRMSFEMAFPPSRTMRPGNHIDIGMTMDIPTDLQRRWGQIYIFQIAIRLRTTANIQNGQQIRSHTSQMDACNIKGCFPLELPGEYSRVGLPPQLWQCHIYPSILPSIALCKMQRLHSLEVGVGFIADNQRFTVTVRIDITVESGAMLPSDAPPAYS